MYLIYSLISVFCASACRCRLPLQAITERDIAHRVRLFAVGEKIILVKRVADADAGPLLQNCFS